MDPAAPVSCSNCKQTTDSSGKTVWVCENCGTENTSAAVVPPVADSAASADAAAAQAAINAALPPTVAPVSSAPAAPSV